MAPGFPLSGVHSGADAKDLHDPQLARIGDAQGLRSAAGGQKAIFSTKDAMSRTASRAVAQRSRAKTWACSMVMICRVTPST